VANVLEGGQDLREMSKANIPTNYKIPTYGTQKAGDFGKSAVLDVHEAAGQTQGSRYHPYFKEQGGFGNTEYNAGEQGLLGIADEMGIPGGMAQAGRWFGGGELTGLKSPRGDALDILERQVAYTLKQQGRQPNPANIREEVLNQIKTGEGQLLPWYKGEGIPDVRETGLQRKDGGSVEPPPFHDFDQIMNRKDGGTVNTFEQRLKSAIEQHMAGGGEVHMEEGGSYPPKKDMPAMTPQRYLELQAMRPIPESQIKKMLEEQYKKEKEEGFGTPQARRDRAVRAATSIVGAPPSLGNLVTNIPHYVTEGVSAFGNYAMRKIPSMSKPASVLDTEGKGDRVAKNPLQGLPEFSPFYDSGKMNEDLQAAGLLGESEAPVSDFALSMLTPYAAAKAPRAIEGGLNSVTAAARRPFIPATLTTEAVSPDLAKFKNPAFQDYVTGQMIGEGSAVPMTTMGGRKTSQTRGQGVYLNEAKELENNPMVGVNIPRAGNLSTNKALRADIATAGQELGQEAMAAHRFVPMATNQIKDASAMMIRGQGGRPLTSKEVMAMANELPDMIVTHSPANGGLMIAPFSMKRGEIPQDFLKAQSVANKVLGKNASVQFGKADPNKDLMYMMRQDYANEGGRGVSQGAQSVRNQLKRMDKNFPLAPQ
jgi:hypothetical protein